MTEIWFYQLQKRTLDQALPALVERTLQRGWRATIQARSPERMAAIDDLLWTFADDSFLPHGSQAGGDPQMQPVWLTCGDDNPNGAAVRFLVDGAEVAPFVDGGYERLILLFDGRDDASLESARAQWRALKPGAAELAFWRETEEGGWSKQG
jgi:DNA polymerase-3 subunit chi